MMKKNSLISFTIVTVLFVLAAWNSVSQRTTETNGIKLLFPQLESQLQDVVAIELSTHHHTTHLHKAGAQWVVANRGGYLTFYERIKPLVLSISALEIHQNKTTNPRLFSRLHLGDVSDKNSKSKQIKLFDKNGNVLASLIVGKSRTNRTTGLNEYFYARKMDEDQSFLVKGSLDFSSDPMSWLDNRLFSIPSDQVQGIHVEHESGEAVHAVREAYEAKNLQLLNRPDGFKVKSQTRMNSLANALTELRFEQVSREVSFVWPSSSLSTTYNTFSGLSVTVKTAFVNDKTWASFHFFADGYGEKQAKVLNEKMKSWVYVVPQHKAKKMTQRLSELIIKGKAKAAVEEGALNEPIGG